MTSLIFLLTFLTLVVLFIRMLIKLIKHKPVRKTFMVIGLIIACYGVTWTVFKLTQKFVSVPMGTQVCFDDWCASIVKAEQMADGDSTVIRLHIKMFNNARGIAQTPSDPRVNILDASGQTWTSIKRQQDFETHNGTQPGIAHRLELHQSMGTIMVFIVPRTAIGLKILIEEGPWITNFLFPEDEQVFTVL